MKRGDNYSGARWPYSRGGRQDRPQVALGAVAEGSSRSKPPVEPAECKKVSARGSLCVLPWGHAGGCEDHLGFRFLPGLLLVLVALFVLPLSAQPLTGHARVIDGDTIDLQSQRIRLHGVDAPELRQVCFRSAWDGCGQSHRLSGMAGTLVQPEEWRKGRR
jgi:hypothetical protein